MAPVRPNNNDKYKNKAKLFYSIHMVQQRSTHYYIIRFESVVILRTVQRVHSY